MTIPAVIAFGDSIVDNGNNNNLTTLVKCNFPPYGTDFIHQIPTGRFSNGKTPADLIAEKLGIKELLPAYLDPTLLDNDLPTGVTFASGSSGYDPQTSQIASVIPMMQQLELFKEYLRKIKGLVGEERSSFILSNSLFLVVAGSDDLANTYFTFRLREAQYDINSYTDLMLQSATDFIKELYKLGARKIAVFNVPPIGCLPSQRTLGGGGLLRVCAEPYNQAALLYNTKLSNMISSIGTRFSLDQKARVVYIDVYTQLFDIIMNPTKYGLEVVDRGCCGTGTIEMIILCNKYSSTCSNHSSYLFWDSFHPTEKGYKILVDELIQTYLPRFF
ncbi:GDSL esterase/lipase EXL3-like [Impatiens glandulifera]|uniref:GDSL esterase/lipase EXL3-like n=1 Tax=Impatiens glandulifera TaxID=253017 RepID=UPI001FB05D16|nr:GDSL esterase/lipase EXL3-like [Impatiens glandulifera]